MENCPTDDNGNTKRCKSRPTTALPKSPTFLDNFDKGLDAIQLEEERNRHRIVLTDEFCSAFKKKSDGSTSCTCGNKVQAPTRCSDARPKYTKQQAHRQHTIHLHGPFDPNKGFRHLAYQPIKAKKNLDRKISTNTLHGIDSVNDLRSWGLSKEERRQHYLDQMILGSVQTEGEPESETAVLLPYRETKTPIPVQRLQEREEIVEQGKTPAKVISEQYHKEKQDAAKEAPLPSSSPPPPRAVSQGTKEVQTPKLSITNLLEELTEDEKKRLYDAMKKLRGDEDRPLEAAANADDSELKLNKLNDLIKELQDKNKDLENEKDKLSQQKGRKPEDVPTPTKETTLDEKNETHDGHEHDKDKEQPRSAEPTLNLEESLDVEQSQNREPILDHDNDKSHDFDKSQDIAENGRNLDTEAEVIEQALKKASTVAPPSQASPPPPPASSSSGNPCDCELKLLKCHNIMLAQNTLDLRRKLGEETLHGQQLMEEIQTVQRDYSQLHQSYLQLKDTTNGPSGQYSMGQGETATAQSLDCNQGDHVQLIQQNKALQQEVAQLHSQVNEFRGQILQLTHEKELLCPVYELESEQMSTAQALEENKTLQQEIVQLTEQLRRMQANADFLPTVVEQLKYAMIEKTELTELNKCLKQEILQLRRQGCN